MRLALPLDIATYQRHEPEHTVLYRIVQDTLETFLAEARDRHERGLPPYVEQALRAYLDCGLWCRGFARAVCDHCGRSLLLAFSCKQRAPCPSCAARRTSDGAAHLVDYVLPDVPVRQVVLSGPFELRLLLAARADAFGTMTRMFVAEVFRWQRERARERGLRQFRSGAVAVQHRFGSSLNLHPHIHAVIPDGVFVRSAADARPEFVELGAPGPADLLDVAFNVHQRFVRWLARRGLLRRDEDEVPPELTAQEACERSALGVGDLVTVRRKPDSNPAPDDVHFERRARVAEYQGYSVYVGEAIGATDRVAREKLLRYCLRPALSLARLSLRRDGQVVYQVKANRRGKATERVMTPLAFMARIAALVPPPRHPLLRFFGVFAPNASWRADVVPEPPPEAGCQHGPDPQPHQPSMQPPAAAAPAPPASAEPAPPQPDVARPRFSAPWRLDWHTLLKRVYDADSLLCACGGRMKFVAVVTEEATARHVLQSMGLPADPPPLARARAPTFDFDPPPAWD